MYFCKKNLLKYISSIFLVLVAASCQYFEKKVPNENELLQNELKQVNWNQVDDYPSVENCEQLSNKKQQKQCFFDFLSQSISSRLNLDSIKIKYPQLDTLKIEVTVFASSKTKLKTLTVVDSAFDATSLDAYLNSQMADLPKISPAIKRGVPVKTMFVLPLKLR